MTLLSKFVVDAGEFTEVKVDLQSTEGIKYLYKKKGGGGIVILKDTTYRRLSHDLNFSTKWSRVS